MPGSDAENGDVYQVYRNATTDPASVGKMARPMACVAQSKFDPETWRAMARSSTDGRPHEGDVHSPVQEDIGLNREGHWSLRWLHDVLKTKTGTPACVCLGCLSEPERTQVLNLYRNRQQ